jgi:hypothetical protein
LSPYHPANVQRPQSTNNIYRSNVPIYTGSSVSSCYRQLRVIVPASLV